MCAKGVVLRARLNLFIVQPYLRRSRKCVHAGYCAPCFAFPYLLETGFLGQCKWPILISNHVAPKQMDDETRQKQLLLAKITEARLGVSAEKGWRIW